jgi:hypothetical protein
MQKITIKRRGFLPCQTLSSTVRLKVAGCRGKNVGCRIRVKDEGFCVFG